MRRVTQIALSAAAIAGAANADIYLWSGNASHVSISGANAQINDAGTFKFEALTAPGGSTLADIGTITIAPGVSGAVTVFIESRADNNTAGAVNVGSIDLTSTAGAAGTLAELRITGDLGTAGAVVVRNVTGPVVVADDIVDALTINNDMTGSLAIDSATATITIARELTGPITATALGDLSIRPTGSGVGISHTGNITIANGYSGTLSIGAGGYAGTLHIGGSLTGLISMSGVSGRIRVDGDLNGGRIACSGLVQNDVSSSPAPIIEVHGSLTGTRSEPLIFVSSLTNTVAIYGCLDNAYSAGPEIQVNTINSGSNHRRGGHRLRRG